MLYKELLVTFSPYIKWELLLIVALVLLTVIGSVRIKKVKIYCEEFCVYYYKNLDFDKAFHSMVKKHGGKGWHVRMLKKAEIKKYKKILTKDRHMAKLNYIEKKLGAYPVKLVHDLANVTAGRELPKEFLDLYKEIFEEWKYETSLEARLAREKAVITWFIKDILLIINCGLYVVNGSSECLLIAQIINLLGMIFFTFLVFDSRTRISRSANSEEWEYLEWIFEILLFSYTDNVANSCKATYVLCPEKIKALVKEISELRHDESLRVNVRTKLNESRLSNAEREIVYTLVENPVKSGDSAMACLVFAIRNYLREIKEDAYNFMNKKSKATAGGILLGYQLAGSLGIMLNIVYLCSVLIITQ